MSKTKNQQKSKCMCKWGMSCGCRGTSRLSALRLMIYQIM